MVVIENASTGAPAGSATLDSSGNFSLNSAFLPAGTYSVKAHYGGDNTYAPSDSATVSVNLSKQASRVVVSFVTFDASNNPVLSVSPTTAQYGSAYILRVDVENAAGVSCQNANSGSSTFVCPSGTVTLMDNGKPLNDFPNAQNVGASSTARLNDRGFIEDQPIQLGIGTHVITATYTADAASSYNSNSSSNSLSITISQASTTTSVSSNVTSVTSGGNVTLTATVTTNSNSAVGPTGTVQFTSGGSNLGAAATCTPTAATSSTSASCRATLTTALSALPPGPIEIRPRGTPFVFIAWIAAALAIFAFMFATILAAKRRQYAYAGLALVLLAIGVLAGCGAGAGNSGSSSGGGGTSRNIAAKYSGDANYAASTSSAISVAVK
jgi:hypothetical protein